MQESEYEYGIRFTTDETIEGSHHTFTVKVEKEHSRQQYVK